MKEGTSMHPDQKRSLLSLPALTALALCLAGCSHQKPTTYQGYVEGKFVYVASPEEASAPVLPAGATSGTSERHWRSPSSTAARCARRSARQSRLTTRRAAFISRPCCRPSAK